MSPVVHSLSSAQAWPLLSPARPLPPALRLRLETGSAPDAHTNPVVPTGILWGLSACDTVARVDLRTGMLPLPVLEAALAFGCTRQTPDSGWLELASSAPPVLQSPRRWAVGSGVGTSALAAGWPHHISLCPFAARGSGRQATSWPSPELGTVIAGFLLLRCE